MPRENLPIRRRLGFGRNWRWVRNTRTKWLRSSNGAMWARIRPASFSRGVPGPAAIACSVSKKPADALHADMLKGDLLRGEIVIEARLPDAEQVGDVLRAGAVIAAFGENPRGGLHDLAGAAARVAVCGLRGAGADARRGARLARAHGLARTVGYSSIDL